MTAAARLAGGQLADGLALGHHARAACRFQAHRTGLLAWASTQLGWHAPSPAPMRCIARNMRMMRWHTLIVIRPLRALRVLARRRVTSSSARATPAPNRSCAAPAAAQHL